MPSPDSVEARQFYARMLAGLGPGAYAQGWRSRASQQARFAALAAVGDLSGCQVLDVGCGLADLCGYLGDRGIETRYRGIDLTPEMVSAALRRDPSLNVTTHDALADDPGVVAPADYVLASGLFSHMDRPMAERVVHRMFGWCRRAVAFNCLSAWAPEPDPDAYHEDPVEMLGICRALTPWIVLRHDYLPNDFTLYLYRQPPT